MTQDGEGDASSKKASSCVNQAGYNGILDAIVVKFVIGPEGWQSSSSNGISKENLKNRGTLCQLQARFNLSLLVLLNQSMSRNRTSCSNPALCIALIRYLHLPRLQSEPAGST